MRGRPLRGLPAIDPKTVSIDTGLGLDPPHEMARQIALPYLDMGVTTYSSAVFNFVPAFATNFYAAVRRRDHQTIHADLRISFCR